MKISPKKKAGFTLFAILMMLLFNAPIMTAINKKASLDNSPLLFLYMSISWVVCIILIYLLISFRSFDRNRPK